MEKFVVQSRTSLWRKNNIQWMCWYCFWEQTTFISRSQPLASAGVTIKTKMSGLRGCLRTRMGVPYTPLVAGQAAVFFLLWSGIWVLTWRLSPVSFVFAFRAYRETQGGEEACPRAHGKTQCFAGLTPAFFFFQTVRRRELRNTLDFLSRIYDR